MSRLGTWLWSLWPLAPAVMAVYVLINLGSTQILCPPYTTPLPPSLAVCLPTLWPNLTGPDLVPVSLSWLARWSRRLPRAAGRDHAPPKASRWLSFAGLTRLSSV